MRMFESSDVVPVSGEKDRKGTTRSLFRVTEYSFDTAKSVSTVQVFRLSSTQVFGVERRFHCLRIDNMVYARTLAHSRHHDSRLRVVEHNTDKRPITAL